MSSRILNEHWLPHIRSVHGTLIDYSLERILQVAERLAVHQPSAFVMVVTGTNGKGSTISALEALLLAADYQVGSFTSPYLEVFNEQIRINGKAVTDTRLIQAFSAIEAARAEISLSEFEFTTLAALWLFKQAKLKILLLEVGLGGGNDAVNIVDADLTIVTTIALDHQEYLGYTIQEIAANEAKLLRPGKIGVLGFKHIPQALRQEATRIGCTLVCVEQDFQSQHAALALEALRQAKIPLSAAAIKTGLANRALKGRLQWLEGQPCQLIDVAHNLEALRQLAAYLARLNKRVTAVFSMLKDKNLSDAIALMAPLVEEWHIAAIDHPRGAPLEQLQAAFGVNCVPVSTYASLEEAYGEARQNTGPSDVLLSFGSFHVARIALRGQSR